jgi:hypothetical protein
VKIHPNIGEMFMVLEEYVRMIRKNIEEELERRIDRAKNVDEVFGLLMSLTEAKNRELIGKDAFLMLNEKLKKKLKEVTV